MKFLLLYYPHYKLDIKNNDKKLQFIIFLKFFFIYFEQN